jgi:diguanylate cyclase (GGDEF)-like protein
LVRSGLAIYIAAVAVSAAGALIPGGPTFSALPGAVALAVIAVVVTLGHRLPRRALFALGPLGAALIAYAVATTDGYTDAATLYAWPVLWVACFYGTRATVTIVWWVGVVHAVALWSVPPGVGSVDRWFDVVVSVTMVGAVVRMLAGRNRRLVERLREEARVDPLTGLMNRRGLAERLPTEFARARRDHSPIAAVAIDVDRFKAINDRFGHDIGDRVLAHIARRIRHESRCTDLAARLGGDEFLVILPSTDEDQAREFAHRIRDGAASARRVLPDRVPVSISVGVAAALAPEDAGALVERADRALYAAKGRGRNTVETLRDGPQPHADGDRANRVSTARSR